MASLSAKVFLLLKFGGSLVVPTNTTHDVAEMLCSVLVDCSAITDVSHREQESAEDVCVSEGVGAPCSVLLKGVVTLLVYAALVSGWLGSICGGADDARSRVEYREMDLTSSAVLGETVSAEHTKEKDCSYMGGP